MFNFNNKKKIYQPTPQAHNQHKNNIQSIQPNNQTLDEIQANNSYDQENNKQQQQATQCLLLISDLDMENRNSTNKKYMKAEIGSKGMEVQVEVGPWVNTPYRINKQRNGYKSKTIVIGSICHQQKSNCRLANFLNNTQIKQNKKLSHTKLFHKQKQNYVQDMQHEGQPTTNRQSLNQHNQTNKYKQQQHGQPQQYPSQQQQQQQNETKIYHKYSYNKQNIQLSKTRNRYRKLTCQNQNKSADELVFDKKKNKSQIFKLKLQSNSCKKYGALADNSSIVNVEQRTCQYSQFYLKMSKNNNNKDRADRADKADKQNNYTKQLQRQRKQQSTFREQQFEHILSQIPKKCTESDQIKYKILQNIRKQSLIQSHAPQSQQIQPLKQNKILGRYFKISQLNNSKYKINKNMTIMPGFQKNQSRCERQYQQSNNNKRKYLYDKYRLILSKGK